MIRRNGEAPSRLTAHQIRRRSQSQRPRVARTACQWRSPDSRSDSAASVRRGTGRGRRFGAVGIDAVVGRDRRSWWLDMTGEGEGWAVGSDGCPAGDALGVMVRKGLSTPRRPVIRSGGDQGKVTAGHATNTRTDPTREGSALGCRDTNLGRGDLHVNLPILSAQEPVGTADERKAKMTRGGRRSCRGVADDGAEQPTPTMAIARA